VHALLRVAESDIWINGGYFMLRREIFDVMQPGEELVEAPFARLMSEGRLHAERYDGFWGPLDTLHDLEELEALAAGGLAPWIAGAGLRDRSPA
jgi:glucose-1-phosphate cytidylyltransferase